MVIMLSLFLAEVGFVVSSSRGMLYQRSVSAGCQLRLSSYIPPSVSRAGLTDWTVRNKHRSTPARHMATTTASLFRAIRVVYHPPAASMCLSVLISWRPAIF